MNALIKCINSECATSYSYEYKERERYKISKNIGGTNKASIKIKDNEQIQQNKRIANKAV